MSADVVVIGAGLAGLVTATELTAAGRRVVLLDQEPAASLGGQAWWSFGGLFLVDSPEQRRMGVRDSAELAWSDWLGSAGFADGAAGGVGPDRHGYAWARRFVEFAAGDLRAAEQNPDLTGKDVRLLAKRVLPGAVGPVARFAQESPEFLWADTPAELAEKMNALTASTPGSRGQVDPDGLAAVIAARDAQVASGLGKDPQVVVTRAARDFRVDRLLRVAPPRPLTTPGDGPLLAVRLSVLTRKTLGGIWCDADGRALRADGSVLDGCLHTGRVTGRALAR